MYRISLIYVSYEPTMRQRFPQGMSVAQPETEQDELQDGGAILRPGDNAVITSFEHTYNIYTHTYVHPRNFRDGKGMPLLPFKKYFLQSFPAREKTVGEGLQGGLYDKFLIKGPHAWS